MNDIKSEFEKWLGDVWLSDAEWDESKNTYSDSRIHCMWSAWQHRQSKIDKLQANFDQHDQWLGQRNRDVQELNDIIAKHAAEKNELQKQNAWLSGVAEQENKRANNLQQDKTSTTILLGKTVQEKNELTKQRDSFIKAYEIEMDKSVELQKRLDQQGLIIAKVMSIASDLQKNWEMFEIGKKLEQALKGDHA